MSKTACVTTIFGMSACWRAIPGESVARMRTLPSESEYDPATKRQQAFGKDANDFAGGLCTP